jgi:hypothetical protein
MSNLKKLEEMYAKLAADLDEVGKMIRMYQVLANMEENRQRALKPKKKQL